MGWCVSQWITLGWTIFKHPGMNKTPNHILPNTTTLASWSRLYCRVPAAVGPSVLHCAHPWMPAIASSTDRSRFSGHPAAKQLHMGKAADGCPKPQGERVPLPTTTCHLKPSSSGERNCRASFYEHCHWRKHCSASLAYLKCCHDRIKPLSISQTIHLLPGSPDAELYTRVNRQFL